MQQTCNEKKMGLLEKGEVRGRSNRGERRKAKEDQKSKKSSSKIRS